MTYHMLRESLHTVAAVNKVRLNLSVTSSVASIQAGI